MSRFRTKYPWEPGPAFERVPTQAPDRPAPESDGLGWVATGGDFGDPHEAPKHRRETNEIMIGQMVEQGFSREEAQARTVAAAKRHDLRRR